MQGSMASEGDLMDMNAADRGNTHLDFLFRCNNCIKLIPEAAPIYMRHDSSYCSTNCREKGVSCLYTNLVGQQLKMALNKEHREPSLHHVKSDSSMHSRMSESLSEDDQAKQNLPFRLMTRLGQNILDRIIPVVQKNPTGEKLLKTYSSSVIWGKEYTRNSSFNFLFDYMPNLDTYIGNASALSGDLNLDTRAGAPSYKMRENDILDLHAYASRGGPPSSGHLTGADREGHRDDYEGQEGEDTDQSASSGNAGEYLQRSPSHGSSAPTKIPSNASSNKTSPSNRNETAGGASSSSKSGDSSDRRRQGDHVVYSRREAQNSKIAYLVNAESVQNKNSSSIKNIYNGTIFEESQEEDVDTVPTSGDASGQSVADGGGAPDRGSGPDPRNIPIGEAPINANAGVIFRDSSSRKRNRASSANTSRGSSGGKVSKDSNSSQEGKDLNRIPEEEDSSKKNAPNERENDTGATIMTTPLFQTDEDYNRNVRGSQVSASGKKHLDAGNNDRSPRPSKEGRGESNQSPRHYSCGPTEDDHYTDAVGGGSGSTSNGGGTTRIIGAVTQYPGHKVQYESTPKRSSKPGSRPGSSSRPGSRGRAEGEETNENEQSPRSHRKKR